MPTAAFRFAAALALAAGAGTLRAEILAPPAPLVFHRLPGGLRFALIGEDQPRPAPTLFVLAGSLETMRDEGHFTALGRILAHRGFLSVILDPPAHGEDRRKGEGPGMGDAMKAWRERLEQGDDLVGGFNRRASQVLDYLIKEGYSDPARIGAFGLSRGGFLSFHLAAADPRIKFVASLSPLVDVMALTEFKGLSHPARSEAVSLLRLAPRLAGRPIWIGIGNDDTRVDVDRVIAFARAVVRATPAGVEASPVVPVELVVGPASAPGGQGHHTVEEGNAIVANWILKLYGMPETVPLEVAARE